MRFFPVLSLAGIPFSLAQQYAGDVISAFLPTIPGAEVAFFKIPGDLDGLTLINYYSHRSDGSRIIEGDIKRAVIVLHGLLRDPWNYENDASAVMLDSASILTIHLSDDQCTQSSSS